MSEVKVEVWQKAADYWAKAMPPARSNVEELGLYE